MFELPRADGSARLHPRKLRCPRPLAHDGRCGADQCHRRAARRDCRERPRGAAAGTRRAERAVRESRHGEADDVCDRPRDDVRRCADHSRDRAHSGGRQLPMVVDHRRYRQKHAVSDEEVAVMIVTRKHLSRRTMLRGMGAGVALPLLDAMVPALTALGQTAAAPVRRLGVVYHPNGVIYQNWLPKGIGRDFGFSRVLAPLEPFRDQLIVVTGLSSHQAEALGDGGGDHSRASGTYLTGVHVRKSDSVVENGVSMDQIAAKALASETQLSSLQLTTDDNSLVGSCDVGYSCAYSSTLSWLTPTLPLMTENNPRVLFERLFGGTHSTDPKVRAARRSQDKSILDSVPDRVQQLQRQLGAADNTRVNDYLTSLRDVERRIQKTEEQSTKEVPDVARPAGIPESFDQHAHLLYD